MTKPLSLYDFKNWLSEQGDISNFFSIDRRSEQEPHPYAKHIGKEVMPKVSERKIIQRIETEEEVEVIVEEFMEEGGTIIDFVEKNVLVEVGSGTFLIPRFCVEIK
jgi:lysine/ornithine N-monooxygenase